MDTNILKKNGIAYEKGNYTISAVLARNAMDELTTKPAFDDLRWRLVYPTHYYSIVDKVKGNNRGGGVPPPLIRTMLRNRRCPRYGGEAGHHGCCSRR